MARARDSILIPAYTVDQEQRLIQLPLGSYASIYALDSMATEMNPGAEAANGNEVIPIRVAQVFEAFYQSYVKRLGRAHPIYRCSCVRISLPKWNE